MIASIEGKRGEPVPKPPFPAESGLYGKPTVINNVETLANIPYIIEKGAEWFSQIGTEKSKGTKVFALAGKVNNIGRKQGVKDYKELLDYYVQLVKNVEHPEDNEDYPQEVRGSRALQTIDSLDFFGRPFSGYLTPTPSFLVFLF